MTVRPHVIIVIKRVVLQDCVLLLGENEAITEVTTDFDNNNDGVWLSGHFIMPIVTEDA